MARQAPKSLSWLWSVATVLLACAVSTAGCARRETVATRSAAAYDEAVKKGRPIGSDHGGHGAVASLSGEPPSEPGAGPMAPMDHAATEGSVATPGGHEHSMAEMDHSTSAGVDHRSAPAAEQPKTPANSAGMDHSAMEHREPAKEREGSASPASVMPVEAPDPNVKILPLDPAATLRQDSLDAAVPRSVAEAEKTGGGKR